MTRLQQAWIWLSRIGHCRGFGIQSPTDYHFVRYVINEHWPYYAYADMPPGDDWLRQKLGKLYFRMANHLQPQTVVDLVGVEHYIKAGCRKALTSDDARLADSAQLVVAHTEANLADIMERCPTDATLVVEDIGHHARQWQQLLHNPRSTVAFDLYYCGILRLCPQRAKQSYIINF